MKQKIEQVWVNLQGFFTGHWGNQNRRHRISRSHFLYAAFHCVRTRIINLSEILKTEGLASIQQPSISEMYSSHHLHIWMSYILNVLILPEILGGRKKPFPLFRNKELKHRTEGLKVIEQVCWGAENLNCLKSCKAKSNPSSPYPKGN